MKKLIIIALSLCTFTSFFAQTPAKTEVVMSTEGKADAVTAILKTELNLSSEQEEMIRNVNQGIIRKNESIRQASMADEQKIQILESNKNAMIGMYKSVLTEEQIKKYEELQLTMSSKLAL